MTANLMTRSSALAEKTGIPEKDLKGNLFERLGRIREAYQGGKLNEDQLGKMFPIVSRGGAGKMSLYELLNDAWPKLGEYMDQMTAPSLMKGDMTGQDLESFASIMPNKLNSLILDRQRSGIAAERSTRDSRKFSLREAIIGEVQQAGGTEFQQNLAAKLFSNSVKFGVRDDRAFVDAIDNSRLAQVPGIGRLVQFGETFGQGGRVSSPKDIEPATDAEISKLSPASGEVVRLLREQNTMMRKEASSTTGRNRPLPSMQNN